MTPSQRIQVYSMAVIRSDHRKAGEATLSGLGLSDDRQMALSGEVCEAHVYMRTPVMGLTSQLTSERFSRMMSARSSMSGCRESFLPYASISARSSAAVTR